MWINYYMSVTVKVQFGDKLFKLSPGITSLAQVQQEMKRRYQERLPLLQYYCDDAAVEHLQPLLDAARQKGKNSVKLEARPASSFSADNDFSIISIASSQISELKKEEEKRVALPVIEYHMPREFYCCYNCSGAGVYADGEVSSMCEVCKGRGELNNDHKYIIHLKKLFNRQQPPSQQEQRKEFPKVFKGLSKFYILNIAEVNKVDRMEVGKEFYYQFEVQNAGKDLPEDLEVVNCETKEAQKVKSLKAGEKMLIEVGPFRCENEAVMTQAYYLCYRTEEGWERLGYRFGLRVKGFRAQEPKKMESQAREMLKSLKVMSGSKKSVEYL